MYMQGLANFIDDFLGGLMLISYALVVGSVLWSFFILRVFSPGSASDSVVLSSVRLLNFGSKSLAITVGIKLLIKGLVLWSTLGELPWLAYANTVQFKAGLLRFVLALALLQAGKQLQTAPASQSLWRVTGWLALPLVISGAWLVHAVGRFEDREMLMIITVAHQLAAAIWFGCVAQLLILWRTSRQDAGARGLWPLAISRFANLGIFSVVLLLITGLPLAWTYIGSWNGLFGTGYGGLVVTKASLLVVALGFAWLNNRAGRRWRENARNDSLNTRVPYYIEAETFILVGILFIAATLSSQPPSIDIPDRTATVEEVVQMFMPRLPKIHSPSHEALMAAEPGRVAVVNKVPSVAGAEWSDYNHNIAGIFLTVMSLTAMLSYVRRFSWANYWPVGFIGLGIFLFFRSDAETWPLGPIGFWESTFGNGEVFQHRIATILLFVLGSIEMQARTSDHTRKLQYIFPLLCAFGGILLLTHAHAQFELKSEFLIQSTHTSMGLLAVIMASGRWLELRLAGVSADTQPSQASTLEGRIAGFIAMAAMLLIGCFLMFYREPLY
ncbi:CopD family protein [Candidatus Methylospira mobilis]|uniref:copper resistance D family protein n=1 Tax=Candidatus Methylospira mobilis TaxID=1808979 RepID=UPI0028EFA9F0|nr:CopD family protein [Candidatus Methylospira mobilis]WNV05694.1 CopD family protein [Candidatus Methylospira mobilis]